MFPFEFVCGMDFEVEDGKDGVGVVVGIFDFFLESVFRLGFRLNFGSKGFFFWVFWLNIGFWLALFLIGKVRLMDELPVYFNEIFK